MTSLNAGVSPRTQAVKTQFRNGLNIKTETSLKNNSTFKIARQLRPRTSAFLLSILVNPFLICLMQVICMSHYNICLSMSQLYIFLYFSKDFIKITKRNVTDQVSILWRSSYFSLYFSLFNIKAERQPQNSRTIILSSLFPAVVS